MPCGRRAQNTVLFKAHLSISEAAGNTNPINARSRSNHGSQWPAQINVVLVPCTQSFSEAKQRHLKRSGAAKNVTADADPLLSLDLKNCRHSILLSREIVWGDVLSERVCTQCEAEAGECSASSTEVKSLQTLENKQNSRYKHTKATLLLLEKKTFFNLCKSK